MSWSMATNLCLSSEIVKEITVFDGLSVDKKEYIISIYQQLLVTFRINIVLHITP